MSTTNRKQSGHSAIVKLKLHLNGDIFPISHLAGDYIILPKPIEHPPAVAEIDMWIDDHHRRWQVYLIDGISAARLRTRIAELPAEPATDPANVSTMAAQAIAPMAGGS
jgi:hypothetical protein